jgi:hypothetical protein
LCTSNRRNEHGGKQDERTLKTHRMGGQTISFEPRLDDGALQEASRRHVDATAEDRELDSATAKRERP